MSDTTETSPFYKRAEIPRPEDVKDPSPISLHLMVKNGSSVIDRLLANVGPYVNEIVAVLNDCEDDTELKLASYCNEHKIKFVPVPVTRASHPELYIMDTAKTYEVGRSLGGEEFLGPFTETAILADWGTARNLGWQKCSGKWRLFLDADDVVLDPECLPGLVKILEKNGAEIAASSYEYHVDEGGRAKGRSYRERLAVNKPVIRWIHPIHEVLTGSRRVAHVDGNLVVRDMRDNQGAGIRLPGRNFKILYHRARARDWEVSRRLLADLVMEVRHMAGDDGMISFADNLLALYLREPTWPEERGWVTAMVGEMHEGREGKEATGDRRELDRAIELYEESLEMHPGSRTAFRLCRARFKKACAMKAELAELADVGAEDANHDVLHKAASLDRSLEDMWKKVVEAHDLGVANKVVHQVLDDGPLFEEMEKIHVAGALLELGQIAKAKKFCDEALAAFPENSPLKRMAQEIERLAVALPGLKRNAEDRFIRKLYPSSTYGEIVEEPTPPETAAVGETEDSLTDEERDRRIRARIVLERESAPLSWVYLSFVDDTKPKGEMFIGAVYVRAHGMGDAVAQAHARGINPGGSVAGVLAPPGFDPPERFTNRLLSKAEILEMDEAASGPEKGSPDGG